MSFGKSNLPQNCQLDILIGNSTQSVDDSVGGGLDKTNR